MTEKELSNEKAAKFIWSEALQRSIMPFQWGLEFSSIKAIEDGTEFRINAALIQIQHMRKMDLYKVTIIPDDKQRNPIIYESLLLGRLVPVIDETVRHGRLSENFTSHERIAV